MMSSCVLRLLLNRMPNNADSTCRKVGKGLKRPALHTIVILCEAKTARFAPPNTLTDSCTWFLLKAQLYNTSRTRTPRTISYIVTLPKYTLLYYIGGFCTLLNTLLKDNLLFQIVELYPTFLHC